MHPLQPKQTQVIHHSEGAASHHSMSDNDAELDRQDSTQLQQQQPGRLETDAHEPQSRLFKIWGASIGEDQIGTAPAASSLFPPPSSNSSSAASSTAGFKLDNLNIVYDDDSDPAIWAESKIVEVEGAEDLAVTELPSRLEALSLAHSPGVQGRFVYRESKSHRSVGPQYLNLDSSVPVWRKPSVSEEVPMASLEHPTWNSGFLGHPVSSIARHAVPHHVTQTPAPSSGHPMAVYPPGFHHRPVGDVHYLVNGEDCSMIPDSRQFLPDQRNFMFDAAMAGSYGHSIMPNPEQHQPFPDQYYGYPMIPNGQPGAWLVPAHPHRGPIPMHVDEQEHGLRKGSRVPPICKFFAQGHCARGESCTFAHITATKGTGMAGARNKLVPVKMPPSRKFPVPKGRTVLDAEIPPTADFAAKMASFATSADIVGYVYSLAKDQHGCRLLQRFVEEDPSSFDIIFTEAFDRINELMTDPFGNYLCQKLIDCCGEERRMMVVSKVSEDLVAISLNIHGTRVVQKLVEVISTQDEIDVLVHSLSQSVVTLTKDLNGNHVIQRCLHHLPAPDNQFIFDAISSYCVSVATHKHGCCVLQRCVDYATEKQKHQLISVIIQNVLELVQDAFGNYVVQYVLDLGDPVVSRAMMEKMLGNVTNLAVQKFSSNVVEKCLQIAEPDIRDLIIDEICNQEKLPRLLHDPYANYVIQKALAVSPPDRFAFLIEVLKPHVAALRATAFGKRIQNKIVKRFPVLCPEGSVTKD
eukprot:TRINITY_DN5931_c0_g1_i1.p1 TRINITY_DN5931_c0_g1~~TRINITY_DN5931_c0_g1_i1.p1  ORF type:complete len:749 (+),score=136.68 TRINITY_DN5931_c0_g1_i1:128-2374(+)